MHHSIIIAIPGEPVIQIGWDGQSWQPIGNYSELVKDIATSMCSVADSMMKQEITGSNHQAPGVAQAQEVALFWDGRIIQAPPPAAIPEGAIS